MKKLSRTLIFCLMFCALLPFTTLTAHAEEDIEWEFDYTNEVYNFSTADDTTPQLVGMFYFTDHYTNELIFGNEVEEHYDLRLIIGVIGEEPAKNVQIHFDIGEAQGEYRNNILLQATISADNYDAVSVEHYAHFYDDENCQFEQYLPIELARDRSDSASSVFLADSLDETISLSTADTGDIEPGTKNACEIIIPCVFSSDPPIFTEANQPSNTRFNVITDNPIIGDETTNSIWVTDELGNYVSSLEKDHTYTAHLYVRVAGPEAATSTTIKSSVVDDEIINGGGTWYLYSYIEADGVRRFKYSVGYSAPSSIRLHYIPGSLLLHPDGQEDIALNPTNFFRNSYTASGTKIGTTALDGVVNPGAESACEIVYQFSTTDYDAELEAERAAKEAEKTEKAAQEEEETKRITFSNRCDAWLTDENGKTPRYGLNVTKIYTAHVRIRIEGEGQAEGVSLSCSDIASINIDDNGQNVCFKLAANGVEEKVLYINLDRPYDSEEILRVQYVKDSLRVSSAAGTYGLSSDEFFDYETGCTVGYKDADGIIPTGTDREVEVTYRFQVIGTSGTNSHTSSSKPNSTSNSWPLSTIIVFIVAILEFLCIIYMAFRPRNPFSRFADYCRNVIKSIKVGFTSARANLQSSKSETKTLDDSNTGEETKDKET